MALSTLGASVTHEGRIVLCARRQTSQTEINR